MPRVEGNVAAFRHMIPQTDGDLIPGYHRMNVPFLVAPEWGRTMRREGSLMQEGVTHPQTKK